MGIIIDCPNCHRDFDLTQAFENKDANAFFDVVSQLPPELIRPAYLYLTECFKPAKQTVRWSRALKLAQEIAPMMQQQQIARDGVSYIVPISSWATHLELLVNAPPASMVLPLKSHGYLLSALCAANKGSRYDTGTPSHAEPTNSTVF